jgi:hypothetical protein
MPGDRLHREMLGPVAVAWRGGSWSWILPRQPMTLRQASCSLTLGHLYGVAIGQGLGHTLRFKRSLWSCLSWLALIHQRMELSKLVCPIRMLLARSVTC